jgi:hypothetical protein
MRTGNPALRLAQLDLGLTTVELWTGYVALGGNLDVIELDAYLNDLTDGSDLDHDLIAHTLNEAYTERNQDHPLAYRRT